MEDRLIEAIRKRPCIYDKRCLMYRNKLAKEKAWKAVSQVVGVNGNKYFYFNNNLLLSLKYNV